MEFSDQIKERKQILAESRHTLTNHTDFLTDALEHRIMELESDVENLQEDLENQKDLTKKLKGLLDGGLVELVGELITALDATMLYIDADSVLKHHAGPVRATLTKAKESMP